MGKRSIVLVSLLLVLSILVTACSGGSNATPAATPVTPAALAANEPAPAVKATVLKLGHQAPAGTAYDILANTFKDFIEERSNGKYKIEIYNGGQLGGDRELMEAVQVGNVAFNVLTASDMGTFVPEMEVQDLPYLFTSWEEVYKFLDSDAAEEFYALSDTAGIKTLSFMPRGFRHVTNNKGPITTPADLKGMKIRVAESKIYENTFAALGANPQIMAFSEVFTALQQGTVDGHENTIITIRDYRIDDVQKYVSETFHMFAFGAITMNPALFDGMSAEDQKMFKQAGIDAGKDAGKIQEQNEATAKAELEANGMVFNEVDKQAFIDLVQPVYEDYFKNHDRKYFDHIKAAIK